MRLASAKFKYLDEVSSFLPPSSIPPFEILEQLVQRDIKETYILRSALKDESQKGCLQSGKSLSLCGIDSWQKLQMAWDQVRQQPDVQEIILQKEISWEQHFTLIVSEDFLFVEAKNRTGQSQYLYWTPLAHSLQAELDQLREFIRPLKKFLQKDKLWLLEAGMTKGQIYLFQIHPIAPELVSTIFSSDLAAQMVASRVRFSKNQGLWQLFKTEMRARSFRKIGHTEFSPGLVFQNWEFIFHYFRLFCMMKSKLPDAQSFALFLTESLGDNWPASLVKRHLELANYYRQSESFDPMKLGLIGQGQLFIGKGKHHLVVGDGVEVCDQLSLEMIYRKQRPKIILSKDVGILGHPVLASVENGIQLVLGMTELPRIGDRIYLDFEQKILKVE